MLAIISASMYVQIKIGGIKSAQRIHHDALRNNATFLSRLLKNEFIYQPGTVEENLEETLASMEVCALFIDIYYNLFNMIFSKWRSSLLKMNILDYPTLNVVLVERIMVSNDNNKMNDTNNE
jgi:hypothetical protein